MRTVATAGHVDHGKSTLVRALTGMEPDRLAEEQRRGLSIELGFAWCPLGDDTAAFVDVPGHERFLATMLAGAGAAPAALLVVAADQGWQAQSQEHLDVLDLLGVPIVAAVVTRASLASADRSAGVAADVQERLGAARTDVPVLVVDAVRGDGIDHLRVVLGRRLGERPAVPDVGLPRLWLDRVFTLRGVGTVVTGTLQGGVLERDATLAVAPSGGRVRIRGLQSLGEDVDRAQPGDRVAVNVAGPNLDDLERGQVLVTLPPPRGTGTVDVVVRVLHGQALQAKGAWRLHVGTSSLPVRVRPVNGRGIGGDARGGLRLELLESLPLVVGDRVVLREEGRGVTVAGGRVADPWPGPEPRGAGPRGRHEASLLAIADAAPPDHAAALLALAGGVVRADRVRGLAVDTSGPHGPSWVGDLLVGRSTRQRWAGAVRAALADGPADRTALAAALATVGCPADALDAVLGTLVATGAIARRGPRFVDSAAAGAFDEAAETRRAALVARVGREPYAPPTLADAAREVGATSTDVQAVLADRRLVRHGQFAWTRAAITQATAILAALEQQEGPFTAGRARQALGTTRKYAIPLLEMFDGLGVTVFDDGLRRVRPADD